MLPYKALFNNCNNFSNNWGSFVFLYIVWAPLLFIKGGFDFSKIDENEGGGGGEGVLTIFARKGKGLRQNGGMPYYVEVFWRFLIMQHSEKILMCLSFLC